MPPTRRREDCCLCGHTVTTHFDAQGRFVRCTALKDRDVSPPATALVEALRRIYARRLRRIA